MRVVKLGVSGEIFRSKTGFISYVLITSVCPTYTNWSAVDMSPVRFHPLWAQQEFTVVVTFSWTSQLVLIDRFLVFRSFWDRFLDVLKWSHPNDFTEVKGGWCTGFPQIKKELKADAPWEDCSRKHNQSLVRSESREHREEKIHNEKVGIKYILSCFF